MSDDLLLLWSLYVGGRWISSVWRQEEVRREDLLTRGIELAGDTCGFVDSTQYGDFHVAQFVLPRGIDLAGDFMDSIE
jgi:hypothetical protein